VEQRLPTPLKAETESWNRTSMAVNQVLRASL